jgi:hypothetical protein
MRRLPEGVIKDSPALKTRGFYLVLQSTRKLDFKSLKQIIEKAGELKLNTIFIEYGDRFPYLKNPEIAAIDTLSRKDIRALIKISKANYIKLIPVLQSFGHLDYALRHKTYSKIREVATAPEQLCPSNPESLDFFKSLAGEILEMHKDSEYFHVGGDETRQLGFCPKCMEKVKYVGKSGLFLEYIGKICAWVKSQGKIPVLWDDMLCSYPDILDKLDRDIIIMYWDYWGADGKVPYLVPRYRPAGTREIPRCIAYDKRWDGDWSNEPHPLYMRNFAEPVDLQSDLGEDFLQRFKSYLGAEFPKLINSFPYLQFYIDKGFTVWGAPSCLGEILDMSDGLENEVRCSANIRGFAHDVQQHGGMGIVTTAWYNVLPEYLYNGIILTAQSAWNGSKF